MLRCLPGLVHNQQRCTTLHMVYTYTWYIPYMAQQTQDLKQPVTHLVAANGLSWPVAIDQLHRLVMQVNVINRLAGDWLAELASYICAAPAIHCMLCMLIQACPTRSECHAAMYRWCKACRSQVPVAASDQCNRTPARQFDVLWPRNKNIKP
jgi:hypothetical protein